MQARHRFWLETTLATTAGALAASTVAWPTWIEVLTGLDPDHGSGGAEWFITALFVAMAILLALAARLEWRRAHASPSL